MRTPKARFKVGDTPFCVYCRKSLKILLVAWDTKAKVWKYGTNRKEVRAIRETSHLGHLENDFRRTAKKL